MLIESLEKKTKLAMFTVLLAVSASAVTCGDLRYRGQGPYPALPSVLLQSLAR